MCKKYLGLLIFLFSICFTFSSFAYSFRGTNTDIGGGVFGSLSWKKAAENIEERLSKKMSEAHLTESETYQGLAWKESDYLYYVCTSQGQSYETYYAYAIRFDIDYDSVGAYFRIYDEDNYNIRLNGALIAQDINLIGDVIADSGFRPSKNGLPFMNFSINYGLQQGGLCAGCSWFALQNYVYGETHFVFNIADAYVNARLDTYGAIQDKTLDLSDISSVVNRNLYSYVPDTKYLNSKLPSTSYLYDENNMYFRYKMITVSDIVDTTDWKMVKALSLSGLTAWYFGDYNYKYLNDNFQEYESGSISCLAGELNEIIKEFQKGRPVYVIMTAASGGTHAVLAYAISRDEINENKYYLYLYDSNHPGNHSYSGAVNFGDGYYAEVAVTKGADGEEYLYYNYEAARGIADALYNVNLSYTLNDRYVGNFVLIDADGNSMHLYKKGDKIGQRAMTFRKHGW